VTPNGNVKRNILAEIWERIFGGNIMDRVTLFAALALATTIAACGPAEENTQAPEADAVTEATDAVVEEAVAATEKAEEAAEEIAEVAEEAVAEVAEEAEAVAEEAEAVAEEAEAVAEEVEEAAEAVLPVEEIEEPAPAALTSSGNAEEGQVVYTLKCGGCHAVEDGVTRMGPTMVGLFGAKSGMSGVDVTWDEKTLDAFLAAPKDFSANIRQ
jgi:cytochrome c2